MDVQGGLEKNDLDTDYPMHAQTIDNASQFWTSAFRDKQLQSLKEAYGDF